MRTTHNSFSIGSYEFVDFLGEVTFSSSRTLPPQTYYAIKVYLLNDITHSFTRE